MSNGKNTTYVVLPDTNPSVNYAPPQTTYYYTDMTPTRKRNVCGGCCCCIILLLFFLLFFLIPRDPAIVANSVTVTLNGDLNPQVSGSFEFINRNFYKMEYSNLNFAIAEWDTNDNVIYGHGNYDGTVDLGIRQKTTLTNVTITPTSQIKNLSCYNKQSYTPITIADGSVDAKTTGAVHHNFGSVSVSSGILLLICND